MFTTEDTEGTEEYIFTMKDMKVMKIIHESVNERANGRVHSLTPFFDFFRVFSCLSWLRNCISLPRLRRVNVLCELCGEKRFFCVLLCVLWTIKGF